MHVQASEGTEAVMSAPSPARHVYSMDGAAERLGISRRTLQGWLKAHPVDGHGEPFYSPFGNRKTFDEGDLARIRAAARENERCRLGNSQTVEVQHVHLYPGSQGVVGIVNAPRAEGAGQKP